MKMIITTFFSCCSKKILFNMFQVESIQLFMRWFKKMKLKMKMMKMKKIKMMKNHQATSPP